MDKSHKCIIDVFGAKTFFRDLVRIGHLSMQSQHRSQKYNIAQNHSIMDLNLGSGYVVSKFVVPGRRRRRTSNKTPLLYNSQDGQLVS